MLFGYYHPINYPSSSNMEIVLHRVSSNYLKQQIITNNYRKILLYILQFLKKRIKMVVQNFLHRQKERQRTRIVIQVLIEQQKKKVYFRLIMGHGCPYKKSTAKMRWKWKKKRTRRLQRKRRKMRQRAK